MAYEHQQAVYPEKVKICPKCKTVAIWEMQPNFFRCKGCGWRSLNTGDMTFENVQAKEFIRLDIINELVMRFIQPIMADGVPTEHYFQVWRQHVKEYFEKKLDNSNPQ